MSDFVRLLPESIANQIAAGEVVQRPSSVVKELLENSFDAGATNIKLVFRDGGQTLIQVIDNGKGMSETDARMCWERHATSKIQKAEDLFDLHTFGFRGEALASIAAVAQVEMKTKRDEDSLGSHIVIEASEVKKQEAAPLNTGTMISVKNLFYNIPVRRNFLKSVAVETKYIIEAFQRMAISRPDVSMSLYNGENEVYKLAAGSLETRIHDVLLKRGKGKLLSLEEHTEIVNISGFIGSPELARKTRGNQFLYVNGRFIKDPYFNHAIANSYEGLIESDHHPFYVLFMEVEPSKIDVNVHPTKTEVKFEEGRPIYQIIQSVCMKALGDYNITPQLDENAFVPLFDNPKPHDGRIIEPPKVRTKSDFNPFSGGPVKKKQQTDWEKLYEPFRDNPVELPSERHHQTEMDIHPSKTEVVSVQQAFQLELSHIVCQVNKQLYIIDQQRAHERILYEAYKNQLHSAPKSCQQLLFPRTIVLSPTDFTLMQTILEDVNALGFDISEFGKNTIIVNGTPADITKGEEQDILEGMLELYKLNEQRVKLDKRENLARSMAKNAGIKAGTVLESDEMNKLVQDLFQCEQPGLTPQGKKTFVPVDNQMLSQLFE